MIKQLSTAHKTSGQCNLKHSIILTEYNENSHACTLQPNNQL